MISETEICDNIKKGFSEYHAIIIIDEALSNSTYSSKDFIIGLITPRP